MKQNMDFDVKRIMKTAEIDPLYQQLLANYRSTEEDYYRIAENLSQEDAQIIDGYLAAGEAVYYRFAQIAFLCGKRSRKKHQP